MKKRILGIDTGTNSIGWSIVDYDDEALENKYTLISATLLSSHDTTVFLRFS